MTGRLGSALIEQVERGRVPDPLVRMGVRAVCRRRLARESRGGTEEQGRRKRELVEVLRGSPVAVATREANVQHYEAPTELFLKVLGSRMKYSCCFFPRKDSSLAEAEEAMLALTCERARLRNGMTVLDLGCGWGSLSLWIAEKYPDCRVLAVSNSRTQREHILARRAERGFRNLEVVTADANAFEPGRTFDRVLSVEMFEHMRNYRLLMRRISSWLDPGGKLFVHIFAHREFAYLFRNEGEDDWMARTFFTGGIMPSDDLLLHFQEDLVLSDRWRVSGLHYRETLERWLRNLDDRKGEIMPVLEKGYGKREAARWFHRWRLFFLACSEVWGFRGGGEWFVSHYLFSRREDA
jgi:cyclopropane-fatty-acyl-phospholipid synthase